MYYSTSTNFAKYHFFQVPRIVLSGDPLYKKGLLTKLPFDIKRNKIESKSFISKGLEIQTFFSSMNT